MLTRNTSMTVDELVRVLRARNVRLSADGDRLRVEAPAGALGPDIQNAIRELKPELLRMLGEEKGGSGASIPRVPATVPVALAPVQERVWVFQELEPESTTYNLTAVLAIDGPLDVRRFGHALEKLLERHESLRTLVEDAADGFVLKPVAVPEGVLKFEDLSHLPESERREATNEIARREQDRAFRLRMEIPVRATLVRHRADHHELLTTFHHHAFDGVSIELFYRDLAALYAGSTLAPLPVSYRDYAAWAQQQWQEKGSTEGIPFWKQYLHGAPAELDLPTDAPRSASRAYDGAILNRTVSAATTAAVRKIADSENASLFMVLLAAFTAALHRHTGQRDVVVGTPINGRNVPELQGVIGMFVDQLPLRVRVERGTSLRSLVRGARASALSAMKNQSVPFGRIVEAIGAPRDRSRPPVFQALLNLVPSVDSVDGLQAGDVVFRFPDMNELLALFDGQAKFDLTLYAAEHGGSLHLILVYNRSLFAAERMNDVLDGVQRVLECAADPDASLDRALGAAQRRFKPLRPASTMAGIDETVLHRIQNVARTQSDAVAVEDDRVRLTYNELVAQVGGIAAMIRAEARDTNRPVGVMVPHGATVPAAILGALASGRPYVPLDPAYPAERLRFMAEDADVECVVTTTALRDEVTKVLPADVRILLVEEAANAGVGEWKLPQPDDLAYLLYTSGSTGRPKAVMQTHRNLLVQTERYAEALGVTPDDRMALTASISFDASLMDLFGGLLRGATVRLIDLRTFDLAELPEYAAANDVNVLHVTPTAFRTLARVASDKSWPTVRAVVLGGEPVRAEGIAYFDRAFGQDAVLLNLYGASEHSFSLGEFIDRNHRGTEIPVGAPLGDVEVLLLDADGNEDPVTGEIVLRSAHHALGYRNAPDLTAHAFLPDPLHAGRTLYRTGDLGRRRPDGRIVALGRVDNQMKVRGHRIEPNEIESLLRAHPAITDVAVHAPEADDGDRVLTACCIPVDGEPLDAQALSAWCAQRLPSYMVPSAWIAVDTLPRTPSGKVDRLSLPRQKDALAAQAREQKERGAEEQVVLRICRDVLGHDIGLHEDFFFAGGHSLSATQVVARIRDILEIDFPLRRFFDEPTVAATADWIRTNRANRVTLPPLKRNDALTEHSPLSFAQERMWLIQKLAPESVAYNMGGAVVLDGPLDVDRFRKAMDRVALRQEAMRTHFPTPAGTPVQAVEGEGYRFDYADFESFPESERLAVATQRAVEFIEAPYNLETGPLARVMIGRLAPNRHVLALGMHHIVSDLWSLGILGREFSAAYEDPDKPLAELPVRYRDFSAWQRSWLHEGVMAAEIDHWRERLAGIPALELPTDFPRPPFYTFDGDVVHAPMTAELRSALEKVSAANRATPFMTTLATFNALMSAHSGQTDIAVGVPIANRTQPAVEEMIGTFVNTLVHRNDTSGDPTFRELLQRVRSTALDAFAHQDVPFDLLVKELHPSRDLSRPPFFQVLFNVANVRTEGDEVSGLTGEVIPLTRRTAQFDITFSVALNSLESNIRLSYNTALFTRATAERLLAQYIEMLGRAIANPDIRLSELQRVTDAERKVLLEDWNDTRRDYPDDARVTSLFGAQAQRTPGAVAVDSPSGSFTYGELLAYAQRVTAALQQLGVKPGDRVAILMQRSREMPGALLGILGTGASYVPVDPNYPDARVRYMLEDSGAVAVVTHRNLEREYGIDVPILDLDRWTPPAPASFVDTARDQAAYVIYTSGSTGKPKGVEVPHGAVANFLLGMQERPGIRADDALLAVTTISFDIAVLELYLPLISGARVVIASENEALDGRRLIQRMEESGITLMQATPATWKLLLAAGWEGKPGLRILCGGEALPAALADALLDRVAELWNMYGPTETTVWSTVERIERNTPILIGRPIANTSLYVLREDLQPVPIGVPGELYIGGAGVANGYVNRPDLTAERFVPDPFRPGHRMYRTGDLVRYRADGRVEHLGRLDHQVKVRGFRIELGEIESALRAHNGIRDVAVTAIDDRLVAYIVPSGHTLPPAGELRRVLSATLPQYMLPSVFVPLDAMPLTPNGKVDRKRLPAPAPEAATVTQRKLPTAPSERTIAGIWAELLGISEVGVNDNFFELGGHSLLAMQAVATIEERTGVRIEPRLLFFRSLGELAELLPAG